MRSRSVTTTHSALPDVTADQHHVQLHAAAHLPAGADSIENNLIRVGMSLVNVAAPNQVVTGSGAWSITAAGRGNQATTGVTNPSSCSARMSMVTGPAVLLQTFRLRRLALDFSLADIYANSRSYMFVTDEGSDLSPSLTARHIGIKNLLGVVTFSTADNVAEQTTDISAFVLAATETIVVINFNGVTATCYVNGTLRATHATNVPTVGSNVAALRAFIDNNASANSRVMHLFTADMIFAAS